MNCNRLKWMTLVGGLVCANLAFSLDLVDYEKLSHSIQLETFRSGNHDPDGVGEYKIKVSYFAVFNSEAERKKKWDEQKKVRFEGPEFPELVLENLSFWKPTKENRKTMQVQLSGDMIRKACAQAMSELNIKENQISVMVQVTLIEVGKKYFILDDSKEILSAKYFPIPQTKYDTPMRTNQNLILNDDNATKLTFSVTYEEPLGQGPIAKSTEGK